MPTLTQDELRARIAMLSEAERAWLGATIAQVIVGDTVLDGRYIFPDDQDLSIVVDGGLYVRLRRSGQCEIRLGRIFSLLEILPPPQRLWVDARIRCEALRVTVKRSQGIGFFILNAAVFAAGGLLGHLCFRFLG